MFSHVKTVFLNKKNVIQFVFHHKSSILANYLCFLLLPVHFIGIFLGALQSAMSQQTWKVLYLSSAAEDIHSKAVANTMPTDMFTIVCFSL